jgi:hypothetical protein
MERPLTITRRPRRQENPFADIRDNQRYMVSDIVITALVFNNVIS